MLFGTQVVDPTADKKVIRLQNFIGFHLLLGVVSVISPSKSANRIEDFPRSLLGALRLPSYNQNNESSTSSSKSSLSQAVFSFISALVLPSSLCKWSDCGSVHQSTATAQPPSQSAAAPRSSPHCFVSKLLKQNYTINIKYSYTNISHFWGLMAHSWSWISSSPLNFISFLPVDFSNNFRCQSEKSGFMLVQQGGVRPKSGLRCFFQWICPLLQPPAATCFKYDEHK